MLCRARMAPYVEPEIFRETQGVQLAAQRERKITASGYIPLSLTYSEELDMFAP